MRVQGLGLQRDGVPCAMRPQGRKPGPDTDDKPAHSDVTVHPSQNNTFRSELVEAIRKKVKSGYYNSDSVIDDIGYGFASALDQSL